MTGPGTSPGQLTEGRLCALIGSYGHVTEMPLTGCTYRAHQGQSFSLNSWHHLCTLSSWKHGFTQVPSYKTTVSFLLELALGHDLEKSSHSYGVFFNRYICYMTGPLGMDGTSESSSSGPPMGRGVLMFIELLVSARHRLI